MNQSVQYTVKFISWNSDLCYCQNRSTNNAKVYVSMNIYIYIYAEFPDHCRNVHSSFLSSVTQSCPTLCNPMSRSTPGLPVHHQLPEFTQTHVHRVGDTIQPSHLLSSPSPPAFNSSQHQGLFQWVNYLQAS